MALPELISNSPTIGQDSPLTVLAGNGGSISAAAGVAHVQAAAPAVLQGTGQVRIIIDQEIILVDASTTSGTAWTIIQRGVENTTPAVHNDGAQIWHKPTAGMLDARFLDAFSTPLDASHGPLAVRYMNQGPFGGVNDPVVKVGYNVGNPNAIGVDTAEPQWFMGIEADYLNPSYVDGNPHHVHEAYWEHDSPDYTSVVQFRPIFVSCLRDDNTSHAAIIQLDVGTAGAPLSQFQINAGGTTLFNVSNNGLNVQNVPLTFTAQDLIFTSNATNNASLRFVDGTTTYWGLTVYHDGTGDLRLVDRFNGFRNHVNFIGGANNTAAKTELGSSLQVDGNFGLYGGAPVAKPTVSGAKGGNAALASLIAALVSQNQITDTTTA